MQQKYNQNNSIKFETESFQSSFCFYSDEFILVITKAADNNTHVAFKNCAPFFACNTDIKDVFTDEANHIYVAMPTYNLIEYSNNYSDTSRSLGQFKRDEVPADNADLAVDNNCVFNSKSFKDKKTLVG